MDRRFQLFPDQASEFAPKYDLLYAFIWLVTIFFTLLIFLLVAYFALKYRRRSEAERPRPTVESTRLEMTWTAVPFVIVMVMFFWGAALFHEVFAEPADPLDIHVIGKQWMWKVQHPNGAREINQLHVPVNQTVQLTMASQDVIHSFFIPAFRVKQDVLPGRYTKMTFTATEPGTYHLFCAEYCGTQHSGMIGTVVVMEEDDYDDWLSGAVSDLPPAEAGRVLFESKGCATCHGGQAPTMAGLFGRRDRPVILEDGTEDTVDVVDEAYIRESILNSQAKLVPGFGRVMPSYRGQLSEEQLIQLVAYIKSERYSRETGDASQGADTETEPPQSETPGKSPSREGAGVKTEKSGQD